MFTTKLDCYERRRHLSWAMAISSVVYPYTANMANTSLISSRAPICVVTRSTCRKIWCLTNAQLSLYMINQSIPLPYPYGIINWFSKEDQTGEWQGEEVSDGYGELRDWRLVVLFLAVFDFLGIWGFWVWQFSARNPSQSNADWPHVSRPLCSRSCTRMWVRMYLARATVWGSVSIC